MHSAWTLATSQSRRALFDLVISRYRSAGMGWPQHVFWVPGRLEVFGKHTDYGGGRTLVAAVPRGFAIAIGRRADSRINVFDAGRVESGAFETNPVVARGPPGPGSVEGLAPLRRRPSSGGSRVTSRQRALASEIVFASDLPRASGMSSSSALMVGVAAALGRVAALAGSTRVAREHPQSPSTPRPTMPASRTACRSARWPAMRASGRTAAVRTMPRSSPERRVGCPPSRSSRCAISPMWHCRTSGDSSLRRRASRRTRPGGRRAHTTGLRRARRSLLRLWNAAGATLQFACGGAGIVAGCGRPAA